MTSMAFPTAAAGPFYSADYDRYRFIELLLEKERRLAGLTQEELATKCGSPYVKAFHITTMENLTKTISDKSGSAEASINAVGVATFCLSRLGHE